MTNKKRSSPLLHPLSRRLHILLLCMFGLFCSMNANVNFAISITCMVNSTAISINRVSNNSLGDADGNSLMNEDDNACGSANTTDLSLPKVLDYGGTLVWDQNVQNILFSAAFWGGIMGVVPSILFVQKLNPKFTFLVVIVVKAISSAVIPYLSLYQDVYTVFAARFFIGFAEVFVYPAINTIVSAWFPVEEKSTAIAIFTTGNQLALSLGNPLAAFFCQSKWGWPAIFYFSGFISLVWCILWALIVTNHPDECKNMRKAERVLLNEVNANRKLTGATRKEAVPWDKVLTNKAFLAHLYTTGVLTVICTVLMVYLPTYFKQVLRLGVIANGTFTSIPMIFNFAFKLIWGFTVDKLKRKKILTPTAAVKISQCFPTFLVAAALLLVILFVDCTVPLLALILFCMCNIGIGGHTSGAYTSLLSLAPQYTPSLSSLSIATAMIGQLLTPFIVGVLNQHGTKSEWNNVLLVVALMCLSSGVVFTLFGSGEIQKFARAPNVVVDAQNSLSKLKLDAENQEEDDHLQIRVEILRADSVSML